MLRLLRRLGTAPEPCIAFAPIPVLRGAIGFHPRSSFGVGLTQFTESLTRRPKSPSCAKGTGLKSSLTLFLLFMARRTRAP